MNRMIKSDFFVKKILLNTECLIHSIGCFSKKLKGVMLNELNARSEKP